MDNVVFLQEADNVKRKFSLWPRKCKVSKKSLWMKFAYRVRHTDFHWHMDEYHTDRWYSSEQYIMLRLKV